MRASHSCTEWISGDARVGTKSEFIAGPMYSPTGNVQRSLIACLIIALDIVLSRRGQNLFGAMHVFHFSHSPDHHL